MGVVQCSHRIGAWLLVIAPAVAQQTTRVSLDSSGAEGNADSFLGMISADGRCVAFGSDAANLVAGDTNGRTDIFVHDRVAGTTERVSVDSSGVEADDNSSRLAISGDGRFVAFASLASNLVPGDTNNAQDIFVRDRSTGITECVSVEPGGAVGDGWSFWPSISADGRYVAFDSISSNLVPGDHNRSGDVFVRDRSTGITERVSVNSSGSGVAGGGFWASISADGTIVAFSSLSSTLVSGDTNGAVDIFVHDRTTGITERVSVDSSGNEGNDDSNPCTISADGRVVAFVSVATNLDPSDGNLFSDVYVHDRRTGTTECVSLNMTGSAGNDDSFSPMLSADGRFAGFSSEAWDLVWNDTNGHYDVFLRDRETGVTERVSVDSSGFEAHGGGSIGGSMTPNGELIAFGSSAWSLDPNDNNGFADTFVRDRCDAYWLNYDAGFPGTLGVPAFTAEADPVLGSTLTLDLENSLGAATTGLLFVGVQRTALPTAWGGNLLVVPIFADGIAIPAAGATFSGKLPNDPLLCDLAVDLQVFEFDPGASKSVAFTPGLELILGR